MYVSVHHYMLKKKNVLIAVALVSVLSCFSLVTQVFAATVYLTTSAENISAGDVVPVDVRLDTEGSSINVVEGSIVLESEKRDVEMRELSVAGADLALWTRKPSWDKAIQSVSFVGGEPGGINGDNNLLFRMFVIPQSKGQLKLVPEVMVYANDGKGTVIPVAKTPLSLVVEEGNTSSTDQWRDTVAGDNTPPTIVSAEIGNDDTVYEGKLFLVIRAEDDESGIDRFEIKEGDRDPVRSGSEYVLQDQDQSTKIIVAVFDKAGNVQLLEISPLSKSTRTYVVVGIIIGAVAIISVILIRRKKKN